MFRELMTDGPDPVEARPPRLAPFGATAADIRPAGGVLAIIGALAPAIILRCGR
jgi:hypothetical protein